LATGEGVAVGEGAGAGVSEGLGDGTGEGVGEGMGDGAGGGVGTLVAIGSRTGWHALRSSGASSTNMGIKQFMRNIVYPPIT